MRQFRSQDLPARARIDGANKAIKDWYGSRLKWETDRGADFNVEMSLTCFGNAMFSVHRSTGGRILNRPAALGARSTCVIHAALCGRQSLEIDGRTVHLEEGEFTLTFVNKPIMRESGQDVLAGSLHVPGDIMRRYVKAPERILGRVFPGHGLSGSVSSMIRSMHEMEKSQALATFGDRLTLHLLDLFGLCTATIEPGESRGPADDDRVARIKSYVSANIHDPDLSVESVAQYFALSSRYIHMLFARENNTLSAFIRSERLERCRADLASESMQSRPISDVVFAWGFNDLSHFCRTFRRTFGVSARDYRAQALRRAAVEPSLSA